VGKSQWIYITVMLNGDERRRKGPLCATCFVDTIAWLTSHALKVPDDGLIFDEVTSDEVCMACKEPARDGYCMFATDYASKSERRDWYGCLCEMCALGAASVLDDGMPVATQRAL